MELAALLGISSRVLREYLVEGMPGATGSYCYEDAKSWLNIRGDRRKRNTFDDEDRDFDSADSPQLERYRAARADLAELELAKKRGEVIAADDVRAFLQQFASLMRGFGERLGKVNPELARELEDTLSQGAALADQAIGYGDTSGESDVGA